MHNSSAKVTVLGAGLMGHGIAQLASQVGGFDVSMLEQLEEGDTVEAQQPDDSEEIITRYRLYLLILAAVSMNIPRHSGYINEGVAGLFFLLAGAIFPIEILPGWLQPVSKALPFTYWLEAIRRAVLPEQHPLSPTLGAFSTGNILAILVATTLGLAVLSHYTFILCENTARRRGVIDRTTSY
jgi:hypothetical protein